VKGWPRPRRAYSNRRDRRLQRLLKLMVDPAMPPAIRLRAADYVLKHSLKSLEDDDLETRLALLEDARSGGPGATVARIRRIAEGPLRERAPRRKSKAIL
jgi:hypothetical protein